MKIVFFAPNVELYLNNLTELLYNFGYFSFYDSSERYVTRLIKDIEDQLPYKSHKQAPKYFEHYGDNLEYASFKKNNQTTWHVFFNLYLDEFGAEIYVVKYIGNNHTLAKFI